MKLPQELIDKIALYNIHPIAEILKALWKEGGMLWRNIRIQISGKYKYLSECAITYENEIYEIYNNLKYYHIKSNTIFFMINQYNYKLKDKAGMS